MTGVKFLFRVTQRRLDLVEAIYHLSEPQRAPVILSVNEVKRLLAVARPLKAKVMLSIACGTGMRASEVCRLADSAIVRHRGKIKTVIKNARKACQLIDTEGSLTAFIWRFEASEHSCPPN